MTWNRLRPWLGTLIRLVLGAVWIWAAWSKLREPRTFVQAVRAYDATPEWLSKGIGYGLPVLEFALGVLLIVGVTVRLVAAVSAVLFLVFLIGIIQVAARGIQLDCGCFGGGGVTSGGTSYTLDILRDLGLLALAVYLVLWSFTHLSVEEYVSRHDHVEMPSAKRMRDPQARRKYEAQVAAKRSEARSRNRYVVSAVVVVVALVSLIGIGVQSGRAKISGTVTATNASVNSGVVFGKKAAATVDIYEDFQCPHCRDFEQSVGPTIDKDVRANKAQVRYHTLAFLDDGSNGNRYSSRAANAALCASDISVEDFVSMHRLLFANQPSEGSNGKPDSAFIKLAQQLKITGTPLTDFTSCVQDEQHKALVQAITDKASRDGITSTPTIKVNGKSIGASLSAWNKAVAAALVKGPKPSPSKTPTPTPTPSVTPSGTPSVTPSGSASGSGKPSGSSSVSGSLSATRSSSAAN